MKKGQKMQFSLLKYKNLILLSLILIFSSSASSVKDELDHTGSRWIMARGYKLFDSKENVAKENISGAYTVTELCADLAKEDDLKEISKWNLRGNKIRDKGAKEIAEFANGMISLKELNLSSNEMSEDAIIEFIPLLQKKRFKYLNLARNKGAGSIDAIRKLALELDKIVPNDDQHIAKVNEYLAKIIWIPTNQLDMPTITGNTSEVFIKAHKKYYKKRL